MTRERDRMVEYKKYYEVKDSLKNVYIHVGIEDVLIESTTTG
jgi:hypothetical protein